MLITAVIGCGGEPVERAPIDVARCGWSDSTRLTTQGFADVQLGMAVADLTRRCDVVRDTMESLEGQAQRVVHVRVGTAIARAEIVNDSVWRIATRDSLLRTAEGLGVGTPVSTLLASDPAWAAHGEGAIAVGLRGHCGLSFLLAPIYTAPNQPLVVRRPSDLQKAPPETKVIEVLVVGTGHCDRGAPPEAPTSGR